ncbi:hypothetical protein SE16_01045 [Ardenticatena maritima]|uniref:S-adenosylmethionine decarboxylase proenzyme n=1 Tax=Ardenticatena maritima TaxID=872965 RepID=A0A0P6XYH6_9CHLR|nr:hypothetical protein SE16_01045 [Ardenticatena maritima]
MGKHLIVELWSRSPELLNDVEHIRESMLAAAEGGELTVLNIAMHAFAPHGVTGVMLLAESHLSIHTWPEYGYAAVDVFTCGGLPYKALEILSERLDAERTQIVELDRGVL